MLKELHPKVTSVDFV